MLIYKIADAGAWQDALARGHFDGSADDLRDGFVHLSTAAQLAGTLARHFAGRSNLVIVAVEPERLGDRLKWEPSRGGVLFPHCYAPLPVTAAAWWRTLAPGAGGVQVLPDEVV